MELQQGQGCSNTLVTSTAVPSCRATSSLWALMEQLAGPWLCHPAVLSLQGGGRGCCSSKGGANALGIQLRSFPSWKTGDEPKCWRLFVSVLSRALTWGPWNKPQMCLLPCSHGETALGLFLFPSRFYRVLDQASRIPVWLLVSKDSQSILQAWMMLAVLHCQGSRRD